MNSFLPIKALSKWKYYTEFLSCILWSAAWTDIIFFLITYGWKKEDDFRVVVWFERKALPGVKKLTAILLGNVNIDTQKLDIIAEI